MRLTAKFIIRVSLTFFGLASVMQLAMNSNVMKQPIDAKQGKILVIEAEDLGMAHSINKATFTAFDHGWITSAGVLSPTPWFSEVIRWAHIHPDADLGVAIDLNAEWASYRWRASSDQSAVSGLNDSAGYLPNNAQYIARHAKPEEVAVEIRAQVDRAKRAGLPITHLDAHGNIVLFTPWLFQEYWKVVSEYQLPPVLTKEYILRHGAQTSREHVYNVGGVDVDISTVPIDRMIEMEPGVAQKDWLSSYERTLAALPPGTYLLKVHLGYNDEELQAMTVDHPNWGAQWRQNDLDVVSSPEFQKFLKDQGFTLIHWEDLKKIQMHQ